MSYIAGILVTVIPQHFPIPELFIQKKKSTLWHWLLRMEIKLLLKLLQSMFIKNQQLILQLMLQKYVSPLPPALLPMSQQVMVISATIPGTSAMAKPSKAITTEWLIIILISKNLSLTWLLPTVTVVITQLLKPTRWRYWGVLSRSLLQIKIFCVPWMNPCNWLTTAPVPAHFFINGILVMVPVLLKKILFINSQKRECTR